MEAERSDAQLLVAARADPEAFGVLFDRHFQTIHRYLARRVGSATADDLSVEVFIVALRRLDRYDSDRLSALPWLYGIATNMLRHHQRSERRRFRALAQLASDDSPPAAEERILDRLAADDLLDRVSSALARLPSRDRDPLLLHIWEGLSYDEISRALGIPVGTVRSRINRVRRSLRELVGEVGQERE